MNHVTQPATPAAPYGSIAQLLAADQVGIRLEIVRGVPLWEMHPGFKHQKEVDRIRATLEPTPGADTGCGCFHYADVYVCFSDGSLKRPDIAIFCQEPPETDEALEVVPEAVIEIVSAGYEAKDLEFGPLFYLAQGVKDVVVFDPRTLLVLHVQREGTRRLVAPVEIELACGCRCRV